jgi:glycosyltransferase involved in cell wall biosynthesis
MKIPLISMVMSVYNGAKYLRESVESVLSQEGIDFEFIIVDDGSTDDSGDILAEYAARDDRIRVIEQQNSGLTRALIRGCKEAKGKYIARQDAADISLAGRLRKQLDYLKNHKQVNLVSCWTVFVGPGGEELYRVQRRDNPEEATRRLCIPDVRKIQAISHHGSAMFRKADYVHAGGYRKEFYFAQDLDLWLRFSDFGLIGCVPEILYKARFSAADISARYHDKQREIASIIIELATVRSQGGDESELLENAAKIGPVLADWSPRSNSKGHYFIGKCLLDRGDWRGIKYLARAIVNSTFLIRLCSNPFAKPSRKA